MVALSKVFPTLDCCSCITIPKMSAVANHANIEPCVTDRPGIYVTGTASAPMDIVDSIISAGSATIAAAD